MKLSKKAKIVLVALAVSSVCLSAQSFKDLLKGAGGTSSGSIFGSTKYDIKNYKSKKPAKLSKEASVQKIAALLDKAEAALLKKDYRTSQKYYDQAEAIPFTVNTPEADARAIGEWSGEIGKYLQHLNPDNQGGEK